MTIEECNDLVTEVLMAWRFAPEGEQLCGAHLLRWRQLPEKERVYFAALAAPYVDEHSATRVSSVVDNGDGSCTVHYQPPFPEPCGCARPLWADHIGGAVRCSRCLHAWSMRSEMLRQHRSGQMLPYVRDLTGVDRVDMGYAIERCL